MAKTNQTSIEDELRLDESQNIYFSYNYPPPSSLERSLYGHGNATENWHFSIIAESDYSNFTLLSVTIPVKYYSRLLDDYRINDDSYEATVRRYLRSNVRPFIDRLLADGFVTEDNIENFFLLKSKKIHFVKESPEERTKREREKAERELKDRLNDYLLLTDDASQLSSDDIRRFRKLAQNSVIVISEGSLEINELDETIGYLEFIPSSFSDAIRIAFVRCSKNRFAVERKSVNTINRVLRLLMPIYGILKYDYKIDYSTLISFASANSTDPIVAERTTPLSENNIDPVETIEASELSEYLKIDPVDIVVVSENEGMWILSFSDKQTIKVDPKGNKEQSLMIIKQSLVGAGYGINEYFFEKYLGKGDYTSNLIFKPE